MRTDSTSALWRLARLYAIEPVYRDELGKRRVSPAHTVRKILALLGVRARNAQEIQHAIAQARLASWRSMMDERRVVRASEVSGTFPLRLPMGRAPVSALMVRWTLTEESGATQKRRLSGRRLRIKATRNIGGVRYVELALPLPQSLPAGYHRLEVQAEAGSRRWAGVTHLIVTPDRCYQGSQGRGRREEGRATPRTRLWGINVQLYGLRSRRNWGIGDFRDLQDFMVWAGTLGAAMVGVNPLHALPPGCISPYSPSSRLFHHPLYLNIEGIPEFRQSPALQAKFRSVAFQGKIQTARATHTVDYDLVRSLKWPMLNVIYRAFASRHLRRNTASAHAFRRYVRDRGESLRRFAVFQAIQEHLVARPGFQRKAANWREWPRPLRHPDSASVKTFQTRHADRVEFYQYLEWHCERQLQAVQSAARRVGMPIGLYLDLAVGIHPGGADAWIFQDQLAQGVSVGNPPDLFSPRGQNWTLIPPRPDRVGTNGYELFVECVRQNLRHCGLLRIDHAMGLFRLFWVPEGYSAADGAYVHYPADDLLGILALESYRQQAMIVGEDLGTVTPAIRRRLMQAGVLAYRLLMFEKTAEGRFRSPGRYPAQAMAAVTTHDLPTLRGFWIGRDIDLKQRLGLYPKADLIERDRRTRRNDRKALLHALAREGLLAKSFRTRTTNRLDNELARAIYRFLARTPSRLLTIPLEDLLGDLETPNLPGASADRYPIWRRKAGPGTTLEEWRNDPQIWAMAVLFNTEGRSF